MQCEIRIKSPTYPVSSELVIQHDVNDSIYALKSKIRARLGNDQLTEASQKLVYGGQLLQDQSTLAFLKIPGSATFHLVTPPHIQPIPTPPSAQPSTPEQESQEDPAQPIASTAQPAVSTPVSDASTVHSVPQPPHIRASAEAQQPESSPFTPSAQSLLTQYGNVERTNVSYELCYIDGFPYLVKSAERPMASRPSVSSPAPIPPETSTVRQTPLDRDSQGTTPPLAVRQHHVDLPATAAIPVRTPDGRRALILSPEGVRAMAAQGVNVEIPNQNRPGPFGITAASLRHYMSNGVPHAWLFLKLVFLVTMLGTNATWSRFIVLNIIAAAIFFWQSGMLGRAFLRPRAAVPLNQGPVVPPADMDRREPAELHASNNGPLPEVQGGRNAIVPRMWFHSFANAFVGSIVPNRNTSEVRPPPVLNEINATHAVQPEAIAESVDQGTATASDEASNSTQGSPGESSHAPSSPVPDPDHSTGNCRSDVLDSATDASTSAETAGDVAPGEQMRRDW